MTLSDETRLSAIDIALCRMLEDLALNPIDAMRFKINTDRFSDLPQTTWIELESLRCVSSMHTIENPAYGLTGEGWIAALKAAGKYDTPEYREMAVALRAALKDIVKGRRLAGVPTSIPELQDRTGLDAGWIFNALSSRLLQRLWSTDHLDVSIEHGGRIIRVPARFGTARLFGLEAGPFPDP